MPLRVPLARLLPWLRRRRAKRAETDIRRELSLHLELETQQNLERGMSPADAARAARATLGNAGLIREDVRALWGWRWLDQLRQDLRCGARTLARGPGFAAMSVATLALTIGATTTIFSALHGILLRPLPVAEPDRLVRILDIGYVGELVELRERARTLDVSAYVPPDDRTLTGLDEPLRVSVVPIAGRPGGPSRPGAGAGFRLPPRRRAPRRRAGRPPERRAVAATLRRGSGHRRTDAAARRCRPRGAGRHAAGLRLPGRRRGPLGADDRGRGEPGRAVGAHRFPGRPAPSRRLTGGGGGRDAGARPAVRRAVPVANARRLRNARQPKDVARGPIGDSAPDAAPAARRGRRGGGSSAP